MYHLLKCYLLHVLVNIFNPTYFYYQLSVDWSKTITKKILGAKDKQNNSKNNNNNNKILVYV